MKEQRELMIQEVRSIPGCSVFYGTHAASGFLLGAAARFALSVPVTLLDFGNRCDMYFAARELRGLTRDPAAAMKRLRLRRAFTCYQAVNLLETQERDLHPLVILDLLTPFLDENIPQQEAVRLFYKVLQDIHEIGEKRRILIGIRSVPAQAANRAFFLEKIQQREPIHFLETFPDTPSALPDPQLRLF